MALVQDRKTIGGVAGNAKQINYGDTTVENKLNILLPAPNYKAKQQKGNSFTTEDNGYILGRIRGTAGKVLLLRIYIDDFEVYNAARTSYDNDDYLCSAIIPVAKNQKVVITYGCVDGTVWQNTTYFIPSV